MNFIHEEERIYLENEKGWLMAELVFPVTDGVADITTTFVHRLMRGQGVAGKLMREAVAVFRAKNLKVRTTCSYAAEWFQKHPEEQDLLA